MTEEEAKQKWCFAFVASHHNPQAKTDEGKWVIPCIGSECMAWRWGPGNIPIMQEKANERKVNGYCGLAGLP